MTWSRASLHSYTLSLLPFPRLSSFFPFCVVFIADEEVVEVDESLFADMAGLDDDEEEEESAISISIDD